MEEVGLVVANTTVVVVVAIWFWFSLVLFTLECDDTCAEGQAGQWGYTGQFVVAAMGSLLAVIAVPLGLTSKTRTCLGFALAAACCAVVWLAWVGEL